MRYDSKWAMRLFRNGQVSMNVLFGLTQTSSLMGLVGFLLSLVLVASGLGALRFRGQELRVSPVRVMVQGIFGFFV